MNKEIKELLEETIKSGIRDLSFLPSGSKEKSTAFEDLVKLYKLRIEETRNERDFNEKVKDRYFRLGVETLGIILPLIFYAVWMERGFRFEETGTFTSTTFRGLFNRSFKK